MLVVKTKNSIPLLILMLLTMSFAHTGHSQKPLTAADSTYLTHLNTQGNLMIAGGIGLCGAGAYLIYQGNKTYNYVPPVPSDPAADIERNHRQGTIFYAVGGVAILGGLVCTALGAKSKIDFKRRKKILSMQAGLLDSGRPGIALLF